MKIRSNYKFDTLVIHAGQSPEIWEGSTLPPIFQTASFRYDRAEELHRAFKGETEGYIYTRLTNPTNHILEKKLSLLEGGKAAIVTSSGMAAIANTCFTLLREGDEFVAGNSLFMSTYLLFTNILKKYGIKSHLVDPMDIEAFEQVITDKTRFLYLETIGNPKMDVPDIENIAKVAQRHNIPLVVDNTLATPFLCRPLEWGANIVVHSTTKYLSGHGNAVGGVIIDGDNFDWNHKKFPDLKPYIKKERPSFLDKIWREIHINFGTTQSPFNAYLTIMGLDTLSVRMERHLANALKVANFLKERKEVKWVNYPGLKEHPSHQNANKLFNKKGYGAMISFALKDEKSCFKFIRELKLIYHLANLGDCKTLIIHPYSSQYVSFDEETKRNLAILPNMLRLSVGIEAVDDICEDIAQALDKCR